MGVIKADIEHIEQIAEFQLSMAMETEELALHRPTVVKGIRHVLDNPSIGHYRLYVDNNQVVASLLVLLEWSDWRNGNVAWVHSVYVLPEYRNKGIFSLMYESLKEEVKIDNQLYGIRLYVDKSNELARKVYEKLGMSNAHYELYEWLKSY